ncbi:MULTISPECIES: RusA family crossover junction endodeoxyribonuclease [unclassified Psychrobacillus]|uniref:RusA family crossover junction endodeoxyribonuclease n=1 Tax=unclassified Psychrobacillus TaxID=2636677 RepID=UPI0018A23EC0
MQIALDNIADPNTDHKKARKVTVSLTRKANEKRNLADGMSKVIWHDDAQIVKMNVRKFYSENPRAVVKVEW